MTNLPKARRFHASAQESARPVTPAAPGSEDVRVNLRKKTDAPPAPADERERFMRTDPTDDGFGDLRLTDAPAQDNAAPEAKAESPTELERKLAEIRAEKMSERQLRIARRIATLHKIRVDSDEEAVLRLRERGIDPSHRAALSQVLSDEGNRAQSEPARNAPAVVPKTTGLPAAPPGGQQLPGMPSREPLDEGARAAEIFRIQRDLARRRRRRMFMLATRLLLLVALPTAIAGWYYFRVATPLYATISQFRIQIAEPANPAATGSLLAGSQLATNPDAVAVQSYLTSRDAMLRLDADHGFRQAFQQPAIDPIKRLPENASNEETYRLYEDSVKIGYDPTEGMIDMEVIAPTSELSAMFSDALFNYAEEKVDQMSARLRDDQMKGSTESYNEAEAKVIEAQRRVQDLQQKLGVLDPVAEGTVIMNQIATLQTHLTTKELELGQIQTNPRPQQSRVTTLQGDIARLKQMIEDTRKQLTQGDDARTSLAAISGELRVAEGDLQTRQQLLAAAAAQMEAARIEAGKQVRYLSLSVAPVPPDEPTYPKAFQNTLVAFLIFSGIYLMLSLTASILREQVSS
ncbi:capsule biosynthesis protein [Paracoccus sp. (in: a-proteobacteria)]|uniref:capsule biosynthesis protein n=1 Tax=Paracoccus sp. TaxID=267 RepID=UPI003A856594